MAALELQLSRLQKALPKNNNEKANPDGAPKVRFTAKGFRTLRRRLGLTAEAIGILLGVTAQTIYNWEADNSSPREQQLLRIVKLRGMGKREVNAILQGLAK